MIDWANLTFGQTILLAIVLFLASIGTITLTYIVIRIAQESKIDDLNDYYTDCDMSKVKEQWK